MSSGTKAISEVDVLIIGAGPAGLMAANWMSRLGIKTRIVDKRADKVMQGQADGLHARSLEVWESFGIADWILRESNPLNESCFWNPDENGTLRRVERSNFTPTGISHHQTQVMHQGRVEQLLLNTIEEHSSIRVERAVLPERLEFDESDTTNDAYPISVTLRHLHRGDIRIAQDKGISSGLHRSNLTKDDTDDLIRKGQEQDYFSEIVKAKYVIGCDGAHSWTRRQLGFSMEGEQTEYIWGVIDVIPTTDFPDIRSICMIQSASSGSILVIPREKKLVRLYIQLQGDEATAAGLHFDVSKVGPEVILKAAQEILSPYKFTYVYCDWWTVYRIGQRVCNSFNKGNRIFLAGDSVHTHSPKAGQGQNISMQDTYNLGWKIGLVLQGKLKPSILETYELERQQMARELIEFDHKLSRAFSQKPKKDDGSDGSDDGISMLELNELYAKNSLFMTGTAATYPTSPLVIKANGDSSKNSTNGSMIASKQHLANGIPLGMRLPSYLVVNQASGHTSQLQTRLLSDGRFRIIVFGGNISEATLLERVNILGAHLGNEILPRYTTQISPGKRASLLDCPIEVILVHGAPRAKIELLRDLDDVYHPLDEEFGYDYDRVFVDGPSHFGADGKAYLKYGISKERGCVVIVRPDQHVSWIGDLEDWNDIEGFFGGILVPRQL